MKKILIGISLIVIMTLAFTTISKKENSKSNFTDDKISEQTIENLNLDNAIKQLDFFEIKNDGTKISAYKLEDSGSVNEKVGMSLSSNEEVRISYELEYSEIENRIYLSVSVMDADSNVLIFESGSAIPFISSEGQVDALFIIDGNTFYLSEIQTSSIESCFFISLFFGSAALVAAIVTALKVTLVIVAVIVVAGITYELAKVTKDFLNQRAKEAEKEKNNNNPRIYYPSQRSGNFLIISPIPMRLNDAAPQLRRGRDFYTPLPFNARKLADNAGGAISLPEVNRDYNGNPIKGHYMHYHIAERIGGHSFYGFPHGHVYA